MVLLTEMWEKEKTIDRLSKLNKAKKNHFFQKGYTLECL